MWRKVIVAAMIVSIVTVCVYVYELKVAFPSPDNCTACHFIVPYYKQWKTSTHNKVPCLKCHDYTPTKAMVGQFMFMAGKYNPRPLTDVPDRNCLQSGCHDKRLVDSKVLFTKRGITFDHKVHYSETRRGIKLHCRSCHSDIVQGSHVKVSMNVCFLCHFKGVSHDAAFSGCPSCHSAPKEDIMVNGKAFSHAAALKAGYKCNQCHLQVSVGEGVTPKDKCFFCHVDRGEKYNDVQFIHEKHVNQKQVDCLWCHDRIEHGKIKMADNISVILSGKQK